MKTIVINKAMPVQSRSNYSLREGGTDCASPLFKEDKVNLTV